MLPKSNRLNLLTDFKRVATGKKIETKFCKLFIKMGDNPVAKIGIAVPSKFFKNATHRNRARRLLAAAFQSTYHQLPENINIVALPKERILEVKSADVLLDLQAALRNEKVIN